MTKYLMPSKNVIALFGHGFARIGQGVQVVDLQSIKDEYNCCEVSIYQCLVW